jgi:hypothetical protein
MTCECSCACSCNDPGSVLLQPTCLRCGSAFEAVTQSASTPQTSREGALVLRCTGCGCQELLRVTMTSMGDDQKAARRRQDRAKLKQEAML